MSDGEGLTYKRPVRCGCGQDGCPRCRVDLACARLRDLVAQAAVARAGAAEIQSTVDGILERAGW